MRSIDLHPLDLAVIGVYFAVIVGIGLRDRRNQRAGIRMLRVRGHLAGVTDPVEQADFLLRRLYPEMPEQWFSDVVAKLAALHALGTWHGFQRP